MMNKQGWTRRQFSQALAVSATGSLIARPGAALVSQTLGLAFVGSVRPDGSGGAIHAFRVCGTDWQHAQSLLAEAPAHLVLHPVLPVLYVVHNVPLWDCLPRGAVSVYDFRPSSGEMVFRGTQPLSLSAIHPTHATLTKDGSHLLVAAERGGIYNVLPVAQDGSLKPVSSIRKEFGMENGANRKTAAPHAVALHVDGSLFAADAGQESLTRFHLDRDALVVRHRTRVHTGEGPSRLALASSGTHAYASSASSGAISVHALGISQISQTVQTYAGTPDVESLLMLPGDRYLIAAAQNGTDVLRIDPGTGRLARHTHLSGSGHHSLNAGLGGRNVLGLDRDSGRVLQTAFDPALGVAGASQTVARVEDCVSLVCCEMDYFSRQIRGVSA